MSSPPPLDEKKRSAALSVGKAFFCGVPLIAIGAIWLGVALKFEESITGKKVLGGFGAAYVIIGLLVFTRTAFARKLAVVAWFPLLFGVPVGTVLAFFAIKFLLGSERPAGNLDYARSLTPAQRADIILQLFRQRLGGSVDLFVSFDDAGLHRGHLLDLLDQLHTDYGFPISSTDADGVNSIHGVISLVESRIHLLEARSNLGGVHRSV